MAKRSLLSRYPSYNFQEEYSRTPVSFVCGVQSVVGLYMRKTTIRKNEAVIKELASFVAQSFLTRLHIISALHHFVSTDRTVGACHTNK